MESDTRVTQHWVVLARRAGDWNPLGTAGDQICPPSLRREGRDRRDGLGVPLEDGDALAADADVEQPQGLVGAPGHEQGAIRGELKDIDGAFE